MEIMAEDFHPEGVCADRDLLADTAESRNADGFPHQLMTREALPLPRAHRIGLLDNLTLDCQQQSERVLSDRGVVHPRAEGDRYF